MVYKKYNLLDIFLLLSLLLLLVPKIILIEFFSHRWVETGIFNISIYLLQDLILVIFLFFVFRVFVSKGKLKTIISLGFISGCILVFLLLDMRVRELWLKPIDFQLVKYWVLNFSDLISGAKIFFNSSSGFGFTFRFIVFVVFIMHLFSWSILGWCVLKSSSNEKINYSFKYKIVLFLGFAVPVFISLNTNSVRYDLNKNVIVGNIASVSHFFYSKESIASLNFEQPSYNLSEVKTVPKTHHKKIPDFKNLAVVILESVRWNSVFGTGSEGKTTILEKMSIEGMKSKSYVSVPHSSKGYYAILSGLHAYPDIEIKEAMGQYQANIIHILKKKKNMDAISFSSLNYQFENMGGFLNSIGVTKLLSASELKPKDSKKNIFSSSFGASDDYLYTSSIPHLKEINNKGKGFVALYFPSAAHYPYGCIRKLNNQSDKIKYEGCIQKTDDLIGGMLAGFKKEGILDSTLFVFVGDHGESFGEHGLFIHNSSMYEEEVTVPLIFWASNKRLASNGFSISQQIDIAPTIADFFGVLDSDIVVQGKSLLRAQGERAFFMSTFFSNLSSAIVEHPYKYIYETGSNTVKKYNLTVDPLENSPIDLSESETKHIKNRLSSFHLYQKGVFSK